MLRRKKTGQTTAEYAVVIGLVIAAAVAMQIYVKRGIQGKIRGAVDYKPDAMFKTNQFEPDYAASNLLTSRVSSETAETFTKGKVVRSITGTGEITSRTGTQTTNALP